MLSSPCVESPKQPKQSTLSGRAPGSLRGRHRCFEFFDTRVVTLDLRARIVERGAADKTAREQLLLAFHVRGGQFAHGARLLQLFVDGLDLRRSLTALEVVETRFRGAQLILGLAPCRGLVFPLERKQGGRQRDIIAALGSELLESAGERRCNTHILTLDVALERTFSRGRASCQENSRGGKRGKPDSCAIISGPKTGDVANSAACNHRGRYWQR